MAIFHFNVKRIGGNSGRSSVGAAAYRAGEKLYNKYNDITHDFTKRAAAYHSGGKLGEHDFTRKSEIVHSEIMLPKHAPVKFSDRETLWNSVESAKRQHNEQTSRMVVVALPNELTTEQHIKLVRYYVQKNFVNDGMCADFSVHSGHIHTRKDEEYPFKDLAIQKENPHAHIQLTMRPLNEDGTWANKTKKEYILDKNGNKIRLKSGKDWRSRNVQLTDWEKPETLVKWRENWAVTVNRTFERLGIDERISHLSLKEQGIDRDPTVHMGHKAWNLEKKGIKTEIGEKNRAIMTRNKARETEATPEVTADFMHELKERYVTLCAEISTLNDESNEIKRKINTLMFKSEDIDERAEQILERKKKIEELKTQRQKMGVFANKKAIDEDIKNKEHSYIQAENYFKHKFKIAPEGATAEVERLEIEMEIMRQAQKSLQDRLPALLVDRENFANEYRKRKLYAEVNKDRQRIFDRLERLERETLKYIKTAKEQADWLKSQRSLDKVSEEIFQEVVKKMHPEQAETLIAQRENERAHERERVRMRELERGR